MKHSEMPYHRPDVPALLAELDRLTAEARSADSGEALLSAFSAMDKAMENYETMRELAGTRYTIDTRDPFYSGERDYFDAQGPAVKNASISFAKAVLDKEGAFHQFQVAMTYTPWQRWGEVYNAEKGLERGTIFPVLDLPFAGRRC